MCGRPGTDAHHWCIHRASLKYRWNILNGVYMCRACHDNVKQDNESLYEKILTHHRALWLWSKSLLPVKPAPVTTEYIRNELHKLTAIADNFGIKI